MNKGRVATALIAAALAGCAGPTALQDKWTTEVTEDTARGDRPTDPEPAIKAWLRANLKDPESAQYGPIPVAVEGFASTRRVVQQPTLLNVNGRIKETRQHGWLISLPINAKNGYGGYVGFKTYKFVFRGNALIHGEATQEDAEQANRDLQRRLNT